MFDKYASRLFTLADEIRAKAPTLDPCRCQLYETIAGGLLWDAYEHGFGADDAKLQFIADEYQAVAHEEGTESLWQRFVDGWLVPMVPNLLLIGEQQNYVFCLEQEVRALGRLLLKAVDDADGALKKDWDVDTPKQLAKAVGMTDQQFRNWRKANPECWEQIRGSKKIRCSRDALYRLRNT